MGKEKFITFFEILFFRITALCDSAFYALWEKNRGGNFVKIRG